MAKFKIGDKVRILKYSGTVFEKRAMVGKICEIKDVDEESIPVEYKVWQPDKRDHWFFSETELAQVAKRGRPKKDACCKTGTSKPSEFDKLQEELKQTRDMLKDLSHQFLELKQTTETNICSLGYELGKLTANMPEEKKIELSEVERVILKNLENLDIKFKWIARDGDNDICIYVDKPTRGEDFWIWQSGSKDLPYSNLFQFIRCEDNEPYDIAKLLEG